MRIEQPLTEAYKKCQARKKKEAKLAEIDRTATKFTSEAAARSYRNRCLKPRSIVLGDDGKIWLVTPAEASTLNKAGYEIIEY